MGLHKLLEKLQQKRAKMTVSVAHEKYENHDLSALIFIHKMVDLEMIRDNSFLRKSFHNMFGRRPGNSCQVSILTPLEFVLYCDSFIANGTL